MTEQLEDILKLMHKHAEPEYGKVGVCQLGHHRWEQLEDENRNLVCQVCGMKVATQYSVQLRSISMEQLEDILKLMHKYKVNYFSGPNSLGIQIDRAVYSVSRPTDEPATQENPEPNLDLCPCGHSLDIEHNDAGCLRGCSEELCASKGTSPNL